ncbi:MAG: efflux RND transporter periplasmic adaptor subunit [Mycobacterium leprae]
MKKQIAMLLLLLAFLLPGCTGKTEKPKIQPIPVTVTTVQMGRITATSPATGQIEPKLSVYITPKISGKVTAVLHEMGDVVKAGDLLVELEENDASSQLTQARANVTQADAQRAEAERQFKRLSELLKAGAVSKQQVEQVETQLSLAEAALSAARATLAMAETNYQRTRVTAPADGTLAARQVDAGSVVGTSTLLFQLVDLSTVIVRTGLAENDVNLVQAGGTVTVHVSALNRDFTGTVEAISPSMDRQTKLYPVKVTLPNPDGVLKGGMYAEVRFTARQVDGLILPVAAVVTKGGQSYVFRVEGGQAHQQVVKVTVTAGEQVAVEGIKEGDQVVVEGQNRLFDGAPVKVGGESR